MAINPYRCFNLSELAFQRSSVVKKLLYLNVSSNILALFFVFVAVSWDRSQSESY